LTYKGSPHICRKSWDTWRAALVWRTAVRKVVPRRPCGRSVSTTSITPGRTRTPGRLVETPSMTVRSRTVNDVSEGQGRCGHRGGGVSRAEVDRVAGSMLAGPPSLSHLGRQPLCPWAPSRVGHSPSAQRRPGRRAHDRSHLVFTIDGNSKVETRRRITQLSTTRWRTSATSRCSTMFSPGLGRSAVTRELADLDDGSNAVWIERTPLRRDESGLTPTEGNGEDDFADPEDLEHMGDNSDLDEDDDEIRRLRGGGGVE